MRFRSAEATGIGRNFLLPFYTGTACGVASQTASRITAILTEPAAFTDVLSIHAWLPVRFVEPSPHSRNPFPSHGFPS